MESKKSNAKKVAVNTSSGAKKVREIEKEKVTMPATTAQKAQTSGGTKKRVTAKTAKTALTKKAEAENAKAELRMQAAKARAERKALKKEEWNKKMQSLKERRLEAKERRAERKLQAKERAQERRMARAARKDMLRNETAVQRSERKEREKNEKIALRKQNAELKHALALKKKEERAEKRRLAAENRKHKREQKTERRARRTPGFGGWLAAVISLGTASLIMATIITVGAVNMNGNMNVMGSAYRSNLYEMTELSENLNANLSKLRVATGSNEQRKLLTDVLVQSELMESALQRFPVDMATTNNVSSFVNRTADYARQGLDKLAKGGALDESEKQSLEYMYKTNAGILKELQTLRNTMTEKDWVNLMKGKTDGAAQSGVQNLNNNVIKTPSSIQDGPFAENKEKVTAKGIEGMEEITSSKAEALSREYFSEYSIDTVECKGETTASQLTCFNITLKDTRGREIYAQISKAGGKLIMFNSYEDCYAKNFSQEECVATAEKFLTSLGIENMKPVWLQENGTTANVNFVYEQDGVLCYSDMVIVKVCETKGKAIGMEALPYYLNHGERTMPEAKITEEQAAKALGNVKPATARLALIPYNGEEVLTYEFSGTYEGSEYFVYVDAATGEEVESFTVIDTAQGRLLQ